MEEKENIKRKGSAVSHTVSQLEYQARPSQSGVAGAETRQAHGPEKVDRAVLEMGQGPPSRSLAEQSVSPEPGVAAGESRSKSPSLSGPTDEIVSVVQICGKCIELASRMKGRPMKVLLDSGSTSNFILDRLATILKLKIHSDVDFKDLTLADGSIVWTARYVQFTLDCGEYKSKIIARVFPDLHKECILGMPWLVYENPVIDWAQRQVTI